MANNQLTVFEQAPAYLQKYRPTQESLKEFEVPGGIPIARLSFEGKKFAAKYQGATNLVIDNRGLALQAMEIVVAVSDERIGRAYFPGEFNPANKPVCYSLDSVTPEVDSPKIQHPTCNGCQWSAWNSKGKGQACKQNKRLAVFQTEDMSGEWYGGPLLLRLPPITFKNWFKYIKEDLARDRNITPYGVVTRISFDPQAVWDLNFSFVRYLDEYEHGWVEYWRTNPAALPIVSRVLGVSELGDTVPAEEEPEMEVAAEPAPTPVQQSRPAPAPQARPANAASAPQPAPNPRAHPQQVQEPRQAPTPAPAPAPRPAPPAAAGAPSRAPQPAPAQRAAPPTAAPPARRAAPAPVPAGNGARRPAPGRPAPAPAPQAAQANLDLPEAGAEAEAPFDIDAAVDDLTSTSTQAIFDALDGTPGIPGR